MRDMADADDKCSMVEEGGRGVLDFGRSDQRDNVESKEMARRAQRVQRVWTCGRSEGAKGTQGGTWLNWKPMRASMRALLPLVWWPTTITAGASNGLWKSCGARYECSCGDGGVGCGGGGGGDNEDGSWTEV
jgi:hypothetical protein